MSTPHPIGAMSDRNRIRKTPVVTVRIEPNHDASQIVWNINASDGTKSSGFAKCTADAMRDATAFVEAMMQPRLGGMMHKAEMKVVK